MVEEQETKTIFQELRNLAEEHDYIITMIDLDEGDISKYGEFLDKLITDDDISLGEIKESLRATSHKIIVELTHIGNLDEIISKQMRLTVLQEG